ncbi:uncharacterized protein LOC124341758 [Daphnia pulicaria]|uniref:uncharacterized protein LOC124341758 n=1 Tax=Daphnia pulicaria TaxID=35523 RepID=UPI001EEA8716|nr:uncharacterized protein LOC124341758 [Daphnia pulicaria]
MVPGGFSFIQVPRPSSRRGGGVAVVFKSTIAATLVADSQAYDSFEHMDVRLKFGNRTLRLLVVYRPPRCSESDFLRDFSLVLEILLYGRSFMSLIDSCGLQQHVVGPTHERSATHKRHTLDLVLSRQRNHLVSKVCVGPRVISDHHPVLCVLDLHPPRWLTKKLLTRSLKSIDWDKFATAIANLPLLSAPSDNLDGLVEQYNNGLRAVLDLHAPVRTRTVTLRPVNRWMTSEILDTKTKLRHFERCWRSRQLAIDFEIFQTHLLTYSEMLKAARTLFFSTEVRQCRGDMRALYRLVGDLMGSTTKPSLPTRSSDQEVADDLNQFFCSKVSALTSRFHSDTDSPRRSPRPATSSFVSIHGHDMQLLRFVPPRSSSTPLVKKFVHLLTGPISLIINLSITTGCFPSTLKHAVITPLIKKPGLDPEDLANHRPIAGLSFLSKLIERVVHRQLSTHLGAFNLLPDRQSAYRTNYSTETALLGLYNDLLCTVDAGQATAVCFLDLTAAFDTIDHTILLDSLSTRCGVAADALLWFASYLSGRTQCVRVGDCFSSSVPVPYGVPQGSVNGAILFILLVSALPEQTETDGVIIDQYSDDTNGRITFQLHSKTNHSDQQAAIANLSHWTCRTDRWLFDQHVILNLSKCLFFYAISPHQDHKLAPLPLEMGSSILQPSAEVKHLGVYFDSHLSMFSHIRNVCRSSFK